MQDVDVDAEPWVAFSQSEDLTVRLRNILHDYAFGPGVFRELLQNSDDAGARRFALLLEGVTYPTEGSGLLDARLAEWHGPAICAYNDAAFSDADFEGICRVGASAKRSDHTKIGRYGLGFNATYHLSDVPSFASRDRLCFFDPHEAFLPGNLPGLQLRLNPTQVQRYATQLSPFDEAAAAFGADLWPLNGTIFRFPLRTPELAARSLICRESHSFGELLGVLREFLRGSSELLLFLQSVENVEILFRTPNEPTETPPKRLGAVNLRSAGEAALDQIRRERRLLAVAVASEQRAAQRVGYTLAIDAEFVPLDGSSEADPHRTAIEERYAWLVVARTELASEALRAKTDDELPLRQCAAVAIRVWPALDDTAAAGQAFCFLPLALATGLPAHVSANFALTANRRDLWRRSDELGAGQGARRAAWNEALLGGTVPRAYADALEFVAAHLAPSAAIPVSSVTTESAGSGFEPPRDVFRTAVPLPDGPWGTSLAQACSPALLWATWPAGAAQGAFESLPERVTEELIRRDAAVLWDAKEGHCVSSKAALLCLASEYSAVNVTLRTVFARLRISGSHRGVVEVPDKMSIVFGDTQGVVWLRPQSLAASLRRATDLPLEAADVDALVEYLLCGGGGALTVLHGLRLAPLVGGSIGRFDKPGTPGAAEYWWSEDADLHAILPGRPFIDPASRTFQLLKPRIANAPLNIRLLNSRAIRIMLPGLVPPAWHGRRRVCVRDGVVFVDGEDARTLVSARARGADVSTSGGAAKRRPDKPSVAENSRKTKGSAASKGGKKGPKPRIGRDVGSYWDDGDDGGWEDEAGVVEEWESEACQDDDSRANGTGWSWKGGVEAPPGAPQEPDEVEVCTCSSAEDLERIVHRCKLLWRVVENAHEKGQNPIQLLSEYPCVPTAEVPDGATEPPRLLSIQEAAKCHALAVEDFTTQDRETLMICGVPFVQPGKRLRGTLGIDKASTLPALQAIYNERWQQAKIEPQASPKVFNARLYVGLKPLRAPIGEAKMLRGFIQGFLRKNLLPKDHKTFEALPIFETLGGTHAVPLVPVAARVMAPDGDWDEALRPFFADYVVSWAGEAGDFLAELGRERGSTLNFLAEFMAPRVGLLEQDLCVRFLEAVAALGATPWKKEVPKPMAAIAQACLEAPLVVIPAKGQSPKERKRCCDFVDPDDSMLGAHSSDMAFPPAAYCGSLALSVMRRAGLQSLADDGVFLKVARAAEVSGQPAEAGGALLKHLGERWESLKWPSKAYTALGRLRIFPAMNFLASLDPPDGMKCDVAPIAMALDGPCTLWQHSAVAWTQLLLLHPAAFGTWPSALFRRFGALKDPPPLEVVVANLTEASSLWAADDADAARARSQHRQAIVAEHLNVLHSMAKRSHSRQIMAQHNLARIAFLVLDDGSLTKACDVFDQLHSGGNSESEDEGAEQAEEELKDVRTLQRCAKAAVKQVGESHAASKRHTRMSGIPWLLPAYLRRYRRLLLGIAGPGVSKTGRTEPTVRVGPAPEANRVPEFLRASLNQPELADVVFVFPDEEGREIMVYAHRLILAAACAHFHSSFTSGCSEAIGVGGRCCIELPDWVRLKAVLWLLAYLYNGYDPEAAYSVALRLESNMAVGGVSGRMTLAGAGGRPTRGLQGSRQLARLVGADGEDLCCLLRLSDLYDLAHLKQWTELRLQKLMNPEILMTISTHAYFCNAGQLLEYCVFHMQQLYAVLVGTEEWEGLEPDIKEAVLLGHDASAPTAA